MRRLVLILLAAAALGGDVPVERLPREVVEAARRSFPGLTVVRAKIDRLAPDGTPRTELTYELIAVSDDRELEFLVTAKGEVLDEERRLRPRAGREDIHLSATEVRGDLAFLAGALRERFAYLDANGVDLDAVVAAIAKRGGRGLYRGALALEIRKLLALYLDGHADVSDLPRSRTFLPFLMEAIGDRFVAFVPDRGAFLADGFPWIDSIDGRPVAEWVERLHVVVPHGSPSFRTREALRQLRDLPLCRELTGLRARDTVTVKLRAAKGARRKSLELPLTREPPIYGPWPRRVERAPPVLTDGIAYLPLPRMDGDAAQRVREWMPRFREAPALVVDVRGNGGGTREPLLALYPWLMDEGEPPRVVSAARARRTFPEDHLDARFMARPDDPRLAPAEREAMAAFLAGFRPEWEPPADAFGPWHLLVLSPGPDRYAARVFVLMDDRCFSATDIFLGALKGRPRVTLVGRPSGGGSGFTQEVRLPASLLEVRFASMASFTPAGELYDRHGVAPDVPVEVPPEYFLEGGADAILAHALGLVRG